MGSLNRLRQLNTTTLNLPVTPMTPVTTEGPACVSGVIGNSIFCDAYDKNAGL